MNPEMQPRTHDIIRLIELWLFATVDDMCITGPTQKHVAVRESVQIFTEHMCEDTEQVEYRWNTCNTQRRKAPGMRVQ